ncbi:ACP S-malonyltransferase [Tissierella creatinophila]|uniref:Malonyl CoA-acyl carrier protein transacylase n=1 Tax=Tissierella creatinophila DSM 6911 TaxID=1123403 RepID=A0A1U7M450_TISCR|nr:ACP S-malonyltransferase [Tissierella creatinophila]OLS02071.1 malonyl CoA-acyl carrier protein transacylase [Tissierella creatinophila DSM 6911]
MSKVALLFPGQGSQYVGMGKDFFDEYQVSKEVFVEADRVLNMDLSRIIFFSDEEELQKTENTQPAILTTSISILRALEKEGIDYEYALGLSLGEYSALVAGGVFDFKDAVNIVRERGKFMEMAVPSNKGGMAAILGLNTEKIDILIETCKSEGVLSVANYNCPGQIVLTGEIEAIEKAIIEAKNLGAKKAIRLNVSGPFHSSMLETAGENLQKELLKYNINDPQKKIVSNVDAKIIEGRDEIIKKLVKQVSNSVLFQQSIELLIEKGVDTFIEVGPNKSLTSFIKRTAKASNVELKTFNIQDIDSFKETINSLKGGE